MKHAAKRRGVGSRTLVALLAVVLVVGCVVGGTVAWLIDTSDEVVNTFTYGNINIDLNETTTDYKIVPGATIDKDPKVTVLANSEDCYLFVKVEAGANWPSYLHYSIADGWTQGKGTGTDGDGIPTNVYYREVSNSTSAQEFYVLAGTTGHANGIVTVDTTLDKATVDQAIKDGFQPTLTFTAYAVQKDGSASATEAWAKI